MAGSAAGPCVGRGSGSTGGEPVGGDSPVLPGTPYVRVLPRTLVLTGHEGGHDLGDEDVIFSVSADDVSPLVNEAWRREEEDGSGEDERDNGRVSMITHPGTGPSPSKEQTPR